MAQLKVDFGTSTDVGAEERFVYLLEGGTVGLLFIFWLIICPVGVGEGVKECVVLLPRESVGDEYGDGEILVW